MAIWRRFDLHARNLNFEEEQTTYLKKVSYSVFDELNIENDAGNMTGWAWAGGRGWDIRLNKRNNLIVYGGGNTNNNSIYLTIMVASSSATKYSWASLWII